MGLGLLMALHISGFALWLGGLIAAQSVSLERARGKEAAQTLERLERRFLYLACHPGMVVSIGSGAGLLAFNPGYFLGQSWFTSKLVLAAVLAALTFISGAARRRVGSPRQPPLALLELKRALTFLDAFAILLLAFLRPF